MSWKSVAGFLGVSERTLHRRRIEYDIDSIVFQKKKLASLLFLMELDGETVRESSSILFVNCTTIPSLCLCLCCRLKKTTPCSFIQNVSTTIIDKWAGTKALVVFYYTLSPLTPLSMLLRQS